MNYLGVEPKHVPPVYAPEIVADAILACAESPHRNLRVGGAAKMFTMMEKVAPSLGDRIKERTAFDGPDDGRGAAATTTRSSRRVPATAACAATIRAA